MSFCLGGLLIQDDCDAERVATQKQFISFSDSDGASWTSSSGNNSEQVTFIQRKGSPGNSLILKVQVPRDSHFVR